MKTKKNYFTKAMLCLTLIFVLFGCIALSGIGTTASAATINPEPDAAPLGLVTTISISIGTSGTTVWARAHNDFTLGISTVQVYVELYSSLTYQESYKDMTLESRNYIGDLNINKTLETTAPIDGVQRYWRARVNYKLDKKDWVSKETGTFLVDVNGNVIR
ncbi:MAG: hypothetical protein NC311_08515 [Muribaculaceae bacterium]|nr:hypothetical protein [Muribaculaceae bacterium]